METRASYILVGSFVLTFLIAILAAIVWLAGLDIDAEVKEYDIHYSGSVSGLQVGNPVNYRGIPVGAVTSMRINPDNVEEVLVTIEVSKDTPIKEDAVARLEYQGITGVRYVQIEGGSNEADPLVAKEGQRRPVIESETSALAQVFEKAPKLLEDVEALIGQATKILNDDNLAQVEGTLKNLNRFSGSLADSSTDVSALLESGAKTMAQLERTAKEAEELVGAFAGRGAELADLSVETVREAKGLLSDTRTIAKDIGPIVENADKTVTEYRQLAEDIRRDVLPVAGKANETLDKYGAIADSLEPEVGAIAQSARDTIGKYGDLADSVKPDAERTVRNAAKAAEEFAKIAAAARTASNEIAEAAEEAKLLIAENREPVTAFSNSGLYEFTQLLSEMRELVGSLNRITNQIERDPARFFFGDAQEGYEVQ